MPYPQKTYNTFAELFNDMNTLWVTNGTGEITGVIGNNIVNGILTFVTKSPLNWSTATIWTQGGNVIVPTTSVPGPVIVFATLTPTSFTFADNPPYYQYVIMNMTSSPIPLGSGQFYYDAYGNNITSIPANQITVLFKTANNSWIQGNNPESSGSIPDLVNGQFLTNNGTDALWGNTYQKIAVSEFSSATSYSSSLLTGLYYDIYSGDIGRFLLGPDDSLSEWQYNEGQNGFEIIIPGFNLQNLSYPLFLFKKSQPA